MLRQELIYCSQHTQKALRVAFQKKWTMSDFEFCALSLSSWPIKTSIYGFSFRNDSSTFQSTLKVASVVHCFKSGSLISHQLVVFINFSLSNSKKAEIWVPGNEPSTNRTYLDLYFLLASPREIVVDFSTL